MKSLIANTLLIGFAVTTLGCTATKDEMTKELEEVKRELTTLRASNATLADRLDVLETAPKAVSSAPDDEAGEASGDRPSLEVVHLSPEEGPAEPKTVAEPIDDSPPMVIRGDEEGVAEVVENEPKAKTGKKPRYPKARHPKARYPKRGH